MIVHVGFPTVEGLAAQLAPGRTVYCLTLEESGPGPMAPIRSITNRLMVQARALEGPEVYYCSVVLGRRDAFPGHDDQAEAVRRRVRSALDLVTGWLEARDFRVVNATIARPKDLQYLDGNADFMTYLKKENIFAPTIEVDANDAPDPEGED